MSFLWSLNMSLFTYSIHITLCVWGGGGWLGGWLSLCLCVCVSVCLCVCVSLCLCLCLCLYILNRAQSNVYSMVTLVSYSLERVPCRGSLNLPDSITLTTPPLYPTLTLGSVLSYLLDVGVCGHHTPALSRPHPYPTVYIGYRPCTKSV